MKTNITIGPITLGTTTHSATPPWHPLRIRLHQSLAQAANGVDAFAVLCAVIGACAPNIDGRSAQVQREHIRRDTVDYGERIMDKLISEGVELDQISEVGIALAKEVFEATPTDEEVESVVDFTQAPPETFTASM